MVYEELYWNAAIAYGLGALGFLLVMIRATRFVKWRPLRVWFIWMYLCLVLTPWQGQEPEPYYAPAIIVAAFDFLDLGLTSALKILEPMIQAWILGSAVIVVFAVILLIRNLRSRESAAEAESEA